MSPRRGLARLRLPAVACASLLLALVAEPAAAETVRAAASAGVMPLPATVASVDDTDDDAPDPFEMTLADDGVATGESVSASLTVTNVEATDLATATATISIGGALDDGDDVATWLGGGAAASLEEVQSVEFSEIAPGESATTVATMNVDALADGVYPIVSTYDGASQALEQRDVVIVSSEGVGSVGLVVPITGPVAASGLYAASALATLTGPDGLLTAQLDAVADTDAILAIDPAIPAAIRALGDAAPAEATAWLDRLIALDNDRFALQFADADVAPQIAAGLASPLRPTHLGAFLDESVAEDEPSLHSLMAIGDDDAPTMYWPSPGSASPEIVEQLTATGSARVLVPASSTRDGSATLGSRALAYDDAISASLLAAAEEPDADARERALRVAETDIWRAAVTRDAPLLIALNRMGTDALTTDEEGATVADVELSLSAPGLAGAVDVAMATSAAATASLDEVVAAGTGAVELRGTGPDADRVAAVTSYLGAEPGLDHIATALVNPDLFTGVVRSELQQLLSVSWLTNDDGWQARADNFAALNADRAVAIDVQQQQPVQLLSAEAPMPVWIRNDLPFPARVTVVAVPDDPRLSIERRTEVIAQPDSVTRTTIPIEARVGSGEVTVHYSLEARSGERIGPSRELQVTVRADWERIGIGILVVLVAGLFGLGIFRQVRRKRREAEHAADGIRGRDA